MTSNDEARHREPFSTVASTDAQTCVAIRGEIDMETSESAAAAIHRAAREQIRRWSDPATGGLSGQSALAIEVDLTEVTFMDVIGSRALTTAIRDVKDLGVHVSIRRPRHRSDSEALELVDFFTLASPGATGSRQSSRRRPG